MIKSPGLEVLGRLDRDLVPAHFIYEASILAFPVNSLNLKLLGDFRDDTVDREVVDGYFNGLDAELLT